MSVRAFLVLEALGRWFRAKENRCVVVVRLSTSTAVSDKDRRTDHSFWYAHFFMVPGETSSNKSHSNSSFFFWLLFFFHPIPINANV